MRAVPSQTFCWLLMLFAIAACAEEPDDSRIIGQILAAREQILKTSPNCVFLAFWDFDGTILKGDCSEGLREGEKVVYKGLAQVAIESGFSSIYPRTGFQQFWNDYTNMDMRIGHWLAYPFIPQMLRGARADDVLRMSQTHFVNTLSNYLMASSVKIMEALERGGVQSHVISASAELFVKGAALSLRIPDARVHGIKVRSRDGRLTEEVLYPVTWNTGKLERLKQIVVEYEREGKKVFVLAGFGDSFNTDGPFLKFIATQSLPAGKPIAVFYGQGAEPADYAGIFYRTLHTATVSDNGARMPRLRD